MPIAAGHFPKERLTIPFQSCTFSDIHLFIYTDNIDPTSTKTVVSFLVA